MRIAVLAMALWASRAVWAVDGVPPCVGRSVQASLDRYVIASSAALRDGPAASSELLGYLPIATHLRVNCETDGWLQSWAPTRGGSIGWVRADLVSEEEPSLPREIEKLRSAGRQDRALVKQLADRVIALGALDEGAHEAAILALEGIGESAGAARARRQLAALRSPRVLRAPDEPHLIFVADDGMISPLAVLDQGKLVPNPATDSKTVEQIGDVYQAFSEKYFATRRAYRLYASGVSKGLVLVNRKEALSCDSLMASFMRVPKTDAKLVGGVVTNFDLKPRKVQRAPALTEDQRRQMIELIRAVLRSESVSDDHIKRLLETEDAKGRTLLSIDVGPSGDGPNPLLIATASLEVNSDAEGEAEPTYRGYELWMIAEADKSGRYRLTHQEFNQTDNVQSFSPRRFVTYMDLDMDGQEELVFSGSGYEWWWYEAMGRNEGGWTVLVQGGGGGC